MCNHVQEEMWVSLKSKDFRFLEIVTKSVLFLCWSSCPWLCGDNSWSLGLRHVESSPVDGNGLRRGRLQSPSPMPLFFPYKAFFSKVSLPLWVSAAHLVFPLAVAVVSCESSYYLLKCAFSEEEGQLSATFGVLDEYCQFFQRMESRCKN